MTTEIHYTRFTWNSCPQRNRFRKTHTLISRRRHPLSFVSLDVSKDFLDIQNVLKIRDSALGTVPAYPGHIVLRIMYNPPLEQR